MVLDTHSEIFVWVGQHVDAKQKQRALEIGQVIMLVSTNSACCKLFLLDYSCGLRIVLHISEVHGTGSTVRRFIARYTTLQSYRGE